MRNGREILYVRMHSSREDVNLQFVGAQQLVEPRKCLPETKTTPQLVREEDTKNKIVVRVN